MIKTLYFKSKGSVCKLSGEDRGIEEILKDEFTQHFIPDLKISTCRIDYDVKVDGKNINVPTCINYPKARYQIGLPGRDVVSLCEYLLEGNRQEKSGIYSLNSSTASKNGCAVTFLISGKSWI